MGQSILVVDRDPDLLRMLTQVGHPRGLDVVAASTPAEAVAYVDGHFSAAIVDASIDPAGAVALLGELHRRHAGTELIVTASDGHLPPGLGREGADVLAVLRRPLDAAHLFAMIERAIERHRLIWERGLLNEVAEIVAASLDLDVVLPRAAARVADAFSTEQVIVRLRRTRGAAPQVLAAIGVPKDEASSGYRERPGEWPSDSVMRDGVPLRLDDVLALPHAGTSLAQRYPWRSLVSVPIASASDVMGALTLGSAQPARFTRADERLLVTIGQQMGAAAANARLFERVHGLSEELRASNTELQATVDRLRTTQAQLVQAEKLTSIGQLVAGVAHELNNPLTSIMGYAQLVHEHLRRRPQREPNWTEISDDVQRVVSESERAARIIRNLLTFARQQTARRTREDIGELCRRVIDLRDYQLTLHGVTIEASFAPDLPEVLVDAGQVQQALLNLVLNAEQAMIDREPRRLGVTAVAEPACGAVRVMITDTGHGVDPGIAGRIFDPFFTTRPVGEGTGLGLSIVFGIARGHGGQVWVASRQNEPTTFHLRLPAVDDRTAAGRIVLVAHGDPSMREYLATMCEGWGFRTTVASTALDALAELSRAPLAVALVSDDLLRADPGGWNDVFARFAGQTSVVVTVAGGPDDDAIAHLLAQAVAVAGPTIDLCHLRPALLEALTSPRRLAG